jgi:hypothetical protein
VNPKFTTRTFAIIAVLVCLALAGIVSYYASGSPDGLNRVAIDQGFDKQQKDHGAKDSPLAGYGAKGVDNERLSGAVAGVAGVLVVLVAAGGLGYVVRRRAHDEASGDHETTKS